MSSYECIILIWCVYLISHYKKIINTHRVPLVWRCWFLAKTEFLCSVSASQNSLFPKQRQRVRYTHYQNCDEICACKNLARSPTDIHYLNTPDQFVKIIWSSRTNYYQRYLAKTSARKVASRAPLMSQYNNIIIGINENTRARARCPPLLITIYTCVSCVLNENSFVRLHSGIWPLPKLALPIRLHVIIITSFVEWERARLYAFDAFVEIKGVSANRRCFRDASNGRSWNFMMLALVVEKHALRDRQRYWIFLG